MLKGHTSLQRKLGRRADGGYALPEHCWGAIPQGGSYPGPDPSDGRSTSPCDVDVAAEVSSKEDDQGGGNSRKRRTPEDDADEVRCPICGELHPQAAINGHLDSCLLLRGDASKRKVKQGSLVAFLAPTKRPRREEGPREPSTRGRFAREAQPGAGDGVIEVSDDKTDVAGPSRPVAAGSGVAGLRSQRAERGGSPAAVERRCGSPLVQEGRTAAGEAGPERVMAMEGCMPRPGAGDFGSTDGAAGVVKADVLTDIVGIRQLHGRFKQGPTRAAHASAVASLTPGTTLRIVRESWNPADRNACAIFKAATLEGACTGAVVGEGSATSGPGNDGGNAVDGAAWVHVGWLPRRVSLALAPALDCLDAQAWGVVVGLTECVGQPIDRAADEAVDGAATVDGVLPSPGIETVDGARLPIAIPVRITVSVDLQRTQGCLREAALARLGSIRGTCNTQGDRVTAAAAAAGHLAAAVDQALSQAPLLFTDDETAQLRALAALSRGARQTLLCLASRALPWARQASLRNGPGVESELRELEAAGLTTSVPEAPANGGDGAEAITQGCVPWLSLLTVREAKEVCRRLGLPIKGAKIKDALVGLLLDWLRQARDARWTVGAWDACSSGAGDGAGLDAAMRWDGADATWGEPADPPLLQAVPVGGDGSGNEAGLHEAALGNEPSPPREPAFLANTESLPGGGSPGAGERAGLRERTGGGDAAWAPPALRRLFSAFVAVTGPVVSVRGHVRWLLNALRRLYLADEGRAFTDGGGEARGFFRYPACEMVPGAPLFAARGDMLAYEWCLRKARALDKAAEDGDMDGLLAIATDLERQLRTTPDAVQGTNAAAMVNGSAVAATHEAMAEDFTAAAVCALGLDVAVSALEKLRRFDEACVMLRLLLAKGVLRRRRGWWHLRLSTDLQHLGRDLQSLEAAEEGIADPDVAAGDLWALRKRVLRMSRPPRRWRTPSWAREAAWTPPVEFISANALEHITARNAAPAESRALGTEGLCCDDRAQPAQRVTDRVAGGAATHTAGSAANGAADGAASAVAVSSCAKAPASTPPSSTPRAAPPLGTRLSYYGESNERITVEALALEHYASLGWRGWHCEGRIWAALTALLGWDVVFAPIPGAFVQRAQAAPLDFGTADFGRRRGAAIDALVAELRGLGPDAARERVRAAWVCHCGEAAPGVAWEATGLEEVLLVAGAFAGEPLAAVVERLLRDHASWRAGLPDLVLVNEKTSQGRLVEVKSPGDRLSDQQVAWLHVLHAAGADVAVLRVQSADGAD